MTDVRHGDGPILLLSSSIPDLNFDFAIVVDFNNFGAVLNPNGWDGMVRLGACVRLNIPLSNV